MKKAKINKIRFHVNIEWLMDEEPFSSTKTLLSGFLMSWQISEKSAHHGFRNDISGVKRVPQKMPQIQLDETKMTQLRNTTSSCDAKRQL